MEAVSIRVSPCSSPTFILVALYRPHCQAALEPFLLSFLEGVIDKSNDVDDLVVIGDFNINLLEVINISRSMDDICQSFDLHQLIGEPTRVTESTSTPIDHIYVSEPTLITTSGVIQLGISNHFGIFGSRSTQNSTDAKKNLHIDYRDYKAFNENNFLDDVDATPWQLIDVFDSLDDEVDTMYHLLYQLINGHAPKKPRRIRRDSYPWVNSNIIELIHKKKYAHHVFIRERSDLAKTQYKRARNNLTASIRESKRE